MSKLKLKLIKRGFRARGYVYQYGDITILVERHNETMFFYDKSKGINSGDEIFRSQRFEDFNTAVRKFKQKLVEIEGKLIPTIDRNAMTTGLIRWKSSIFRSKTQCHMFGF